MMNVLTWFCFALALPFCFACRAVLWCACALALLAALAVQMDHVPVVDALGSSLGSFAKHVSCQLSTVNQLDT